MKLSKESIERILDLQKMENSYVLCFGNDNNSILIDMVIKYLGGSIIQFKDIEKEKNTELDYTILIFVGNLKDNDINNIEKTLALLGNRTKIIMDLTGINLSINKRDFALSLMKRYDINLIKGNEKELITLIKSYNIFKEHQIIYLARILGCIIIETDKSYLTDGYNEVRVIDIENLLKEDEVINIIYNCLITIGISHCKERGEKLQYSIIQLIALNFNFKLVNGEIELYDFINKITKVDAECLEKNCRLCYSFKR